MKKSDNNGTFGERLYLLRKKRGLRQDELSKKLGYKTAATVSNAEKDKGPLDQFTLAKIADILNVDLHWLITGQPSPGTGKMADLFIDSTKKIAPYLGDHLARLLEQKVVLLETRNAYADIINPTPQHKATLEKANSDLEKLAGFIKETLEVINWIEKPFGDDESKKLPPWD